MGNNFSTYPVLMDLLSFHQGSSGGWSTFALGIWSSASGNFAPLSCIFSVDLLASLGTTSCMWEI